MTLEKATHEKNYSEKELLQLYKRFDFSLSQLLDAITFTINYQIFKRELFYIKDFSYLMTQLIKLILL